MTNNGTNGRSNGSAAGVSAGVACDPNPEVLPAYDATPQHLAIGAVRFDRRAFVESPCFWFLLGAAATAGVVYFLSRRD